MSDFAQLDWDHLRVFLAVARLGRVAVAARRLQVEHTTVSRRLAALERQLGAPLFHRTASGFLLTPVGEGVLPTAEAMERAAISIGVRAREVAQDAAGLVRLGIPPEFASHWLSAHLPSFREQHPAIRLRVLVGTRALDLSRGEAELAVRSPRPHQTGLVTRRIGRTVIGLYASRAFIGRRRIEITDAASARGIPLLVFTPQLQLLQRASWFQPVLESATIALESNGTHALLEGARQGVGAAVLPRMVARRYEELVPVSAPVAENDVWLVTHPEFRRDPRVRATADFLRDAAQGPDGLV